jgi:hypothetical protein
MPGMRWLLDNIFLVGPLGLLVAVAAWRAGADLFSHIDERRRMTDAELNEDEKSRAGW